MKMKMPFDGFYLKLLDEQNGTHEWSQLCGEWNL